MTGVLPDGVNGAKVVRDATRACLSPTGVQNAYCPPTTFVTTCEITALPSDCTARITPAQINGIVSELLALAVCMDPTGTWNCAAVTNLCAAFSNWKDNVGNADQTTIGGSGTTADPYHILPAGVVAEICSNNAAHDALAACLISTDTGNGLLLGADGGLYGAGTNTDTTIDGTGSPTDPFHIVPLAVVQRICADNAAHDALAACLVSTDVPNGLSLGTDGGLVAARSDFFNAKNFGGSPNTMTAAATPKLTSAGLEPGSILVGIQAGTNTSPTVTMTVDGVMKSVRRSDGTTALAAGDLIAGHEIMYRYDAVNDVWCAVMDMTTGINIPASAAATPINDYYNGGTTTGSGIAYVVTGVRPAMTAAPADNSTLTFTIHTDNTSTTPTITIDGLAPAALCDSTGATFAAGELISGHTYRALYDAGTSTWRVVEDLLTGKVPGIVKPNVIYGVGVPTAAVGDVGDYYFDISNNQWYGPKAAGWTSTNLIGSDYYNLQTTAGTATAYTSAAPKPDMPNAGPRDGSIAVMTVHTSNTGTNPTLACPGGTARGLRRGDGTNILAGDLILNHNIQMIYDGANNVWRCVMDLTTGTAIGAVSSGINLLASGTVTAAAGATILSLTGLTCWNELEVYIEDDSGGWLASAGIQFSSNNGGTWDTNGYTNSHTSSGGLVTNRITQFVYSGGSVTAKAPAIVLYGLNDGGGVSANPLDYSGSLGTSTDASVRNAMKIFNDGSIAADFTYRVYGTLKDC